MKQRLGASPVTKWERFEMERKVIEILSMAVAIHPKRTVEICQTKRIQGTHLRIRITG
jgi:hypothetical protein